MRVHEQDTLQSSTDDDMFRVRQKEKLSNNNLESATKFQYGEEVQSKAHSTHANLSPAGSIQARWADEKPADQVLWRLLKSL